MIYVVNVILFVLVLFLLKRTVDLSERLDGRSLHDLPYVSGISKIIDSAEQYQTAHASKMANDAESIALHLGLPPETILSIKIAAYLHDCGELAIPKEILNTSKRLSNEEWDLLRNHPIVGEFSLRKVLPANDEVPSLIRWHHERWDGTGYPDRLLGREIPLGARIITVVDAVSAMSEDRPFRSHLSSDRIHEELNRLAGFHFDPEVVKAWLALKKDGSLA